MLSQDELERIERLEYLVESLGKSVQQTALLVSDVSAIAQRNFEDIQTVRVIDTIDVLLQIPHPPENVEKLKELRSKLREQL